MISEEKQCILYRKCSWYTSNIFEDLITCMSFAPLVSGQLLRKSNMKNNPYTSPHMQVKERITRERETFLYHILNSALF
jgi:hypothetical protein